MIFFFAKIMWETDANDYTMYFFNHVFKKMTIPMPKRDMPFMW